MVLSFVLQKKCRINYDSDTMELERMIVEMGGGSNPEEGDEAGQ